MSRLSPHIQAMRAEAQALREEMERREALWKGDMMTPAEEITHLTIVRLLLHLAKAKDLAADHLDAWERQQMEGTHG